MKGLKRKEQKRLRQKSIWTMTSFHYFYQNPLGFPFCVQIERRSVTSRYRGSTISGWQQNQRRRRRQGERQTNNNFADSLHSKRFRAVSEQRKTDERDFRFWSREKRNESQFFAWSLLRGLWLSKQHGNACYAGYFAGASRYFVHFFAVVVPLGHETS